MDKKRGDESLLTATCMAARYVLFCVVSKFFDESSMNFSFIIKSKQFSHDLFIINAMPYQTNILHVWYVDVQVYILCGGIIDIALEVYAFILNYE